MKTFTFKRNPELPDDAPVLDGVRWPDGSVTVRWRGYGNPVTTYGSIMQFVVHISNMAAVEDRGYRIHWDKEPPETLGPEPEEPTNTSDQTIPQTAPRHSIYDLPVWAQNYINNIHAFSAVPLVACPVDGELHLEGYIHTTECESKVYDMTIEEYAPMKVEDDNVHYAHEDF